MKKIITIKKENALLRKVSKNVSLDDIKSKKIQNLITDMKEALSRESHGVALAAPQVGELLRIFIVAGFVFANMEGEEYDENTHKTQVFINPEILNVSKKKMKGDEGCLSVPGLYSWNVRRYEKITISYFDEFCEKHTRGASGFLARIFQHEIDHLNGQLYIDVAEKVEKVDKNFKKID